MKALFWIGLVVLILGIASLIIAVPRTEREGINVGGVSLGVETHHAEKISPFVSGVMIAGGIAALIAGKRRAV
jgi:hypothetical protein